MSNFSTNGIGAYGAELEQKMMGEDVRNIADSMDAVKFKMAASEMDENKGWKSSETKHLEPCGFTVIFEKYKRNPYRQYRRSAAGLLLDVGMDAHEMFRSQDSGETEMSELGIICAKVVAVGPDCKYVKPGEDIYLRDVGCAPVPFGGNEYWAISEQNIICRVANN